LHRTTLIIFLINKISKIRQIIKERLFKDSKIIQGYYQKKTQLIDTDLIVIEKIQKKGWKLMNKIWKSHFFLNKEKKWYNKNYYRKWIMQML